ncbi:MAG: phenylacetate--CoA ligase [Sedimentisphaerales bacterium]|nr:phenylacetate--CoA ligase [Sedimentisphaerales bacterium]MBN2842395.1 phenylacetate--CoA ligase [Sedimentisphaerales bacterium]
MEIENKIWDKNECLSRDELSALQFRRLKDTLSRAGRVPYYREVFQQCGIDPSNINSLSDLKKIPFTNKSDLREHYPLGFLAVDRKDIARVHGSSGTTGKPTFVAYTEADRNLWADLCARFLTAGGLRREHMVQVAFGYGLFTGGFGLHYGIERVGASVVPVSAGNTPRQVMILQDLGADAIICTPSYALQIAEVIEEMKVDINSLNLKFGHFGGEPWTEDMRTRIEQQLNIKAFNNYGLSEIIGPGVSGECICRKGMHIQEDHFIVECIDPATGQEVAPGEYGELVFTSLTKEAMPIIRYRTRDISRIMYDGCECGRTTCRMDRIVGRSDDMLIIRGVNVFPSQIEEAILQVEGVAAHYLIEVDRPHNLDEVTVHVEMQPEFFSDKMSEMQAMRDRLLHEIRVIANISVKINLVAPRSMERSFGKAKRVIDRRVEKGIL